MKPHKSGYNQKVRNYVAQAKQSGAGKHVDTRHRTRMADALQRINTALYPKVKEV